MSDDLVKRLRDGKRGHSSPHVLIDRADAADRIETLTAENERLRERFAIACATIEDIENPFNEGRGTPQERVAFEMAVDEAALIARAALGDTQ